MNPNPPPPDSDDPESDSVFDDFINRNLDLGGLDGAEEDGDEEVSDAGVQFHADGHGRIFLELPFSPPGAPNATSAPGGRPRPPGASPFFPMPFEHDARWAEVMIRRRPDKLRIQEARVAYTNYQGQLILTLHPRTSRRIRVIPNIRPGWTAVRYFLDQPTPGELIEWRGNRAVVHQLEAGYHTVSGLVKNDEMPATRPAQRWELLLRAADFGVMLILIVLVLNLLALLTSRLPLGDSPTLNELNGRVETLQAQVSTLEAQLAEQGIATP